MTPAHRPGDCLGYRRVFVDGRQCRECWVLRNPATYLGDGPAPATVAATPPPFAATAAREYRPGPAGPWPAHVIRPAPCADLGEALPGQTCGCGEKLRGCARRGLCTVAAERTGVACCRTCGDYDPARPPEVADPYVLLRPRPGGVTLAEQIAGVPDACPPGWAARSDAAEAFRAAFDRACRLRTPYPGGSGRGVVIADGCWRFLCGVFVTCKMLRWLGSALPVEVWYNGDADEYAAEFAVVTRGLGVTWRDAAAELRRLGLARRQPLWGWPLKPLAVLLSGFDEVLSLDADCYPLLNPETLFDEPLYRDAGAMFWPDEGQHQMGAPLAPGQWQRFGLAPGVFVPGFESGQFLIDKRRAWHALQVCCWVNDRTDYVYLPQGPCGLYGDKDTFAVSWVGAGQPFAVAPPTRWLHVAFMQHDPQGRTIFCHRCRDKPRLEAYEWGTGQTGGAKMVRCDHAGGKDPPIAHEWKVFDLVEEYRRELGGARLVGEKVRAMRAFAAAIPPAPPRAGTAVMTLTSRAFWPGTYVLLKLLAQVGCRLPVEVWYRGRAERPPAAIAGLPGVVLRDLAEFVPDCPEGYRQRHNTDAILASGRRHVLYVDSDAYPVADPTPLLADGCATWQDGPEGDAFRPELYGLTEPDAAATFTPQGGVKVLDLSLCWRSVVLANRLCDDEAFYFPGQLGEQAQFRAAWRLTGETPKCYGRVETPAPGVLVHALDGRPVFVHRPGAKFAAGGVFPQPARRVEGLPLEAVAWAYYDEIAGTW